MALQTVPFLKSPLPDAIPIFPLSGALLLPGGELPLNIFEPRYIRMVDDALAGARMIGMIQPENIEDTSDRPGLFQIGCAGRLTSFSEAPDRRYLITLTGVRRFRLMTEIDPDKPYRTAQVDWTEFTDDLDKDESIENIDRTALLEAMRKYLEDEGLKTDWEAASAAPMESLVLSLAMGCPFAPNEKQALLEARTAEARAECLLALMQMSGADAPDADTRLQ
ncbi:MAG: LON peptidase substrate-binding domain-containing protein [Pseudomonadota bacterium]